RYPEAVDVTANAPFAANQLEVIPAAAVAAIRAAPGVTDLCEHYATQLLFRGEEVDLSAIQTDVAARHRHFELGVPHERETFAALGRGEIAVSEAFARHFDVAPGDALELPTPAGPRRFRVAGTLNGLAGPAGAVYMDLATFDASWKRPGTLHLMLFTAGEPAEVVAAIRRALPGAGSLFFTENRELLAEAREFALRFDALLFGVASLALFLGGVAIASLLLGIVAARQRELVLLRTAGAAPNQLAALVLCDAALIAAGAVAAGLVLGALVAGPLLQILGEDLGLFVDTHFDLPRLGLFLLLVFAAVLASAALPAAVARRTATLEVSSFG
ncbi:MAG TPA: FtsX-like permease family protein, partial [Myxococcota bacterium]|nr:FtsX-like permease family protein [Myxococcota bacterium]